MRRRYAWAPCGCLHQLTPRLATPGSSGLLKRATPFGLGLSKPFRKPAANGVLSLQSTVPCQGLGPQEQATGCPPPAVPPRAARPAWRRRVGTWPRHKVPHDRLRAAVRPGPRHAGGCWLAGVCDVHPHRPPAPPSLCGAGVGAGHRGVSLCGAAIVFAGGLAQVCAAAAHAAPARHCDDAQPRGDGRGPRLGHAPAGGHGPGARRAQRPCPLPRRRP